MNETNQNYTLKWVKLKKYCQISGDTPDAVHAKRRKGTWLDDVHCKIAPDGNLWINLVEIEKWVESGTLATLQMLRQV